MEARRWAKHLEAGNNFFNLFHLPVIRVIGIDSLGFTLARVINFCGGSLNISLVNINGDKVVLKEGETYC